MLNISGSHRPSGTQLTGTLCLVDLAGRCVCVWGGGGPWVCILDLVCVVECACLLSCDGMLSYRGKTGPGSTSPSPLPPFLCPPPPAPPALLSAPPPPKPPNPPPSPPLVLCAPVSERCDRSRVEGSRLAEACAINASLSALGDVFEALSSKSKHVPYRNCKLTYLLKVPSSSPHSPGCSPSSSPYSCPRSTWTIGGVHWG